MLEWLFKKETKKDRIKKRFRELTGKEAGILLLFYSNRDMFPTDTIIEETGKKDIRIEALQSLLQLKFLVSPYGATMTLGVNSEGRVHKLPAQLSVSTSGAAFLDSSKKDPEILDLLEWSLENEVSEYTVSWLLSKKLDL